MCDLTKKKVILIDGNSLAYRAFFALPLLTNDHGIHTNAVYGFTMMLQNILARRKTDPYARGMGCGKNNF